MKNCHTWLAAMEGRTLTIQNTHQNSESPYILLLLRCTRMRIKSITMTTEIHRRLVSKVYYVHCESCYRNEKDWQTQELIQSPKSYGSLLKLSLLFINYGVRKNVNYWIRVHYIIFPLTKNRERTNLRIIKKCWWMNYAWFHSRPLKW
jgi:hypothetical protein